MKRLSKLSDGLFLLSFLGFIIASFLVTYASKTAGKVCIIITMLILISSQAIAIYLAKYE